MKLTNGVSPRREKKIEEKMKGGRKQNTLTSPHIFVVTELTTILAALNHMTSCQIKFSGHVYPHIV